MAESIRILLRSNNPKQRLKGIQQALQNPNENTLRLLTSLAEKDPDESVRRYATQAAQQLQHNPPRSAKDIYQEANMFLDEANNAMFEGETLEARAFARRAFKLAPQLHEDDLARDVAVYVMKMPADDAIELLLSDRDLLEVDKAFHKKVGYYYSDEGRIDRTLKYFKKWDVTWTDVLLDIGLYIFIITFPVFLILSVSAGMLATSFTAMSVRRLAGQAALIQDYTSAIGYGSAALTLGFIFITVIKVGALLFGLFAFQMLLAHASANLFLGGDGSFRRLIHHALIPVTIYSIFVWLMFFITPLFYAMGMGVLVESGMIDVFNLIGFAVFIYYLSKVIGEAYQFDLGKGCLSLMFPYIVIFGCAFTVIFLRIGTEFREWLTGS